MQLAGTTLDFNVNNNVYYDKAERGFRAHDYLGLYKQKSVRAIFVEQFYETDFKKISSGGSMGTRIFDLTTLLGTEEIPDVEQIAELLRNQSWS